jgi:hypothetical protein
MFSQKWTISLVKHGKFKAGVVQADGLGRLVLKTYFCVIIKWGSLVMSAGANPMNFWPIWSSCILLLVPLVETDNVLKRDTLCQGPEIGM